MNSGWGAGNKKAAILRMPGGWGWGIPVTALAPVPELVTRTGTSLRENSSSHDQEKVGKGSQIRELGAMPCVSCPAHSCSERFSDTMQFSFNCGKIHLM